jgi:hypothetical protein
MKSEQEITHLPLAFESRYVYGIGESEDHQGLLTILRNTGKRQLNQRLYTPTIDHFSSQEESLFLFVSGSHSPARRFA